MTWMKRLGGLLVVAGLGLAGCAGTAHEREGERRAVVAAIDKANTHWMAHKPAQENAFWDVAAYHTGNVEAMRHVADQAMYRVKRSGKGRFAFVDGERQCAGGASYGGHLANWLQGTTTRYRCLVSHAGLVNSEAQWGTSDTIFGREQNAGGPVWERGGVWVTQNPMLKAANFKTPVLVTIGELDYRVPLNNVLEYWSLLQRQQVESRLLVFPTENHWILGGENSRTFYRELESWLDRWEAAP